MSKELYIPLVQAAKTTGLHPCRVRRWIGAGRLRHRNLGTATHPTYYVRVSDIEAILSATEVAERVPTTPALPADRRTGTLLTTSEIIRAGRERRRLRQEAEHEARKKEGQ